MAKREDVPRKSSLKTLLSLSDASKTLITVINVADMRIISSVLQNQILVQLLKLVHFNSQNKKLPDKQILKF